MKACSMNENNSTDKAASRAWQKAYSQAWDRLFDRLSEEDQEHIKAAPNGEKSAQLGLAATKVANETGGLVYAPAAVVYGERFPGDNGGGGMGISIQEAVALGATNIRHLPEEMDGSCDLSTLVADWPQKYWEGPQSPSGIK